MFRIGIALLAFFGSLTVATAQDAWPTHTITIISPYPAGTAPDAIARFVGEQLTSKLGQAVVVENRTGAGGLIGTEAAAKAANDGYTLFLGSLDTQAIIGHLYHPKFDPVKDFAPISLLGRIYNVISASPKLKENTIQALIADGKKGKAYTFGSPGVGTNLHLLGELFKLRTGIQLTHVPYRNVGYGITDTMTGRLDLVITGLPPVIGLVKDHKLTPLVITAPHRLKALPDTPTMAEIGYKDLTITGWFGLLAPAGTPAKIIDRLNAKVRAMTQDESYRGKMEKLMIDPVSTSPQEFAELIQSESTRMGDIIKRANVKAP